MAYITISDFAKYTTTEIPYTEFSQLADRASEIIDALTGYKIPGAGGLDTFPQFIRDQVKKAVCAQVETMDAQGGNDTVVGNGSDSNVKTASVGKFSFSTGSKNGGADTSSGMEMLNGIPLSPLLKGYLWPTGLLYAGVVVCG
ncbi:hypothetical protein LJC60_01090 [Ruminococcaceae bacterium OttesenSCG-928-D13]|nr:hypothetical protein [Ruminococcaceae bacterium OttesenSCG-928-D13]